MVGPGRLHSKDYNMPEPADVYWAQNGRHYDDVLSNLLTPENDDEANGAASALVDVMKRTGMPYLQVDWEGFDPKAIGGSVSSDHWYEPAVPDLMNAPGGCVSAMQITEWGGGVGVLMDLRDFHI